MFGFGKKHRTPDPAELAQPPSQSPAPSANAAEAQAESEMGGSDETPKKPWFGKFFKGSKTAAPSERPEPSARLDPVGPLTMETPPTPVKPAVKPQGSPPAEPVSAPAAPGTTPAPTA